MLLNFKIGTAIVTPIAVGLSLIFLMFKQNRPNTPLSLALAYGLGLGILSQWMLLLAVTNINFHLSVIGLPILVTAFLVMYFVIRRNRFALDLIKKPVLNNKFGLDIITILILTYIIFHMLYIFWTAFNIPVHVWDEIERVAFKAKFFSLDRSIKQLKYLPHPSYPLLVEFVITWITLNLQLWNDQIIKMIIPLFFLSYAVMHFSLLRNFTDTKWALGGVALLIASPLLIHHATIVYADLPLMFYNCGTIILLLLWNIKRADSYLIMASLFAGLASFTKVEGVFYFAIYFILLIIFLFDSKSYSLKTKVNKFLKFAIPCLSIFLFYFLYKIGTHTILVERTGYDFSFEKLNRVPVVFEAFARNLFLSGNWGVVWLLLILSLINLERIIKIKQIRLLLLCLLMYFGIHFAVFLMTPIYYWISNDKAYGVLARLILHFYPISTLLIILLNCPLNSADQIE